MRRRFGPAQRRLAAKALTCLLTSTAFAQLRVAEWNVTNYSSGRINAFQTAVYGEFEGRTLSPDIIVAQEFLSGAGVQNFLGILNNAPASPGDWAAAPFINGPDTDNAFFYRTSKIVFLAVTTISRGGSSPNHPRNVERYDVRLAGYQSDGAVLACYSSHMKAGSSDNDQARRLVEARAIRDDAEALPARWHFLLAADLNIQSSSQTAYVELTFPQGNEAGRFWDPIRTTGNWNNNSFYRFVHTQDPSGAGGMDDRYDQILVSADLIDGDGFEYIGDSTIRYSRTQWNDPNHSYRSWGNDGTSYNRNLTVNGNTMVGPVIARALIDAAAGGGHLPVFFDLLVPPHVDSDERIDFGQVPQGAIAEEELNVWNAGDIVLWSPDGVAELAYSLRTGQGFTAPGDDFTDAAGGEVNTHVIAMDTSDVGMHAGALIIFSNAPDEPFRVVELIGEVVSACDPCDMNCDAKINAFDIEPFLDLLFGPGEPCAPCTGDANGDGDIDAFDIEPFLECLFP